MVERLLLDKCIAAVVELHVEVVVASLVGMKNAVVRQILSVQSYHVVLSAVYACRIDVHRHCQRQKRISAAYSDVVYQAHKWVCRSRVGGGPYSSIPGMPIKNHFD